jgi:lipoprotein signal peptidase
MTVPIASLDNPRADVAPEGEFDPARVHGHVAPLRRRRRLGYVAAAVVVADQGSKWWAWRTSRSAQINFGGDVFVGRTVGSLFADPVAGTVFDVLDSIGLLFAFYVLARRASGAVWVVAGGLFLAGWASNTLDRLGLHNWTAPGSRRGVVDFIMLGGDALNVADLSIVIGALGLVVAGGRSLLRASVFAGLQGAHPAAPCSSERADQP